MGINIRCLDSNPCSKPHSYTPQDLCSHSVSFLSSHKKSDLDLASVRDRILNRPMDSFFSHTKKSQGGSSDRGFSDLIQTAASSYFKTQGSEDESASSRPTQHHSSSGSGEKMKPSGGSGEKMNPSGGQAAASAKVLLDAALAKLHKTEAEGGGEGEQ